MSRRNWCMRSTSRKKQSAIVVALFHDFTFDDAILVASILSTGARIFSVVSNTWRSSAA
jgi:hypothetical protein